MTVAAAESWVESPLRRFVEEARVLYALLLYPSGQVLAQHGFTRSVDVMAACALAAAINASAGALGRELHGTPFRELHHSGKERQIFLAELTTGRGAFVFLTVFDGATSLGLVRLYYGELRERLGSAASAAAPGAAAPLLAADFEQELGRNLAVLFGRARPRGQTPA